MHSVKCIASLGVIEKFHSIEPTPVPGASIVEAISDATERAKKFQMANPDGACVQESVWKTDWDHFRRSFSEETYALESGRDSLIIHTPTEQSYTPEVMLLFYAPGDEGKEDRKPVDRLRFPVGYIIEECHGAHTYLGVYVVSQAGQVVVTYDRAESAQPRILDIHEVWALENKIVDATPAHRFELGIHD